MVAFFKQQLPLEFFVETGTFEGDTLDIVKGDFKACFSVDKDDELVDEAIEKFKDEENIIIEHGLSTEFLASIKEHVTQASTLFWFDAHDCQNQITPDVDPAKAQSPILDELLTIETLNEDSVIIIDDARLYLNVLPKPNALDKWPDFQDITLALLAMSENHRIAIYDDTIVYYPEKLRHAFTNFAYNHNIDLLGAMLDARNYREQNKEGDEGKEEGTKGGTRWLKKMIKR